MKIAVISDTHDNISKVEQTLQLIKEKDCEAIIHCGDFCAPFTAGLISTSGLPIYACFGNNDEDHSAIYRKLKAKELFSLADEYGEIIIDDNKIAFCHYPKLGELLAKSGDYQAVFHGHTHEAYQEIVGQTLLANPGAVCGIQKGKLGLASFGIYVTSSASFTLINL
jgi:putative phosphoesterase